ncbi:hypothetical protein IQ266_03645 [filamentous cyanobacterium LEGE 11480]|uniref:Carrier domain-containing protein n=1 Tax=Romeriopsis navalis LEGE 11480 TaxID=2777977 RepID=A0A928VN08_9CYAN|nr:condensation domain-containing protein [Romeriopsis navalis]MBE9028854.1 hypothetical protein [Romeriopsis navalis LEGE 11480]
MDKRNIETIYPLAPLQEMFLWHSLQTTTQAGLLHIRCDLQGEINPTQLKQAWESVIQRHPTLRASVHWQNVKQPLQVIAKQITVPWQVIDAHEFADPQQALTDFLNADRAQGFELTQAPIMRLTLFRWGKLDYKLIWSCHHLMLDGWSGALVLNQVFETYQALQQGQPRINKHQPIYQTYIRWLKQQDTSAAAQFWRATLKGFAAPTPLPGITETTDSQGLQPSLTPPDPKTIQLSTAATTTLQAFLRSQHLTLSTVMQGIWALVLHHHSCTNDVLFGMTVSGRQGNLAGVEAIVGLLINVLPIRVAVTPEQSVATWLQTIQTQQIQANRYAYATPAQIQDWSGQSQRLFNSLLVIENYPIHTNQPAQNLKITNLQSGTVSNYDLTVIVQPGDAIQITLETAARQFNPEVLATLLEQFSTLLQTISQQPEQAIHALLPALQRPPQPPPVATNVVTQFNLRDRPANRQTQHQNSPRRNAAQRLLVAPVSPIAIQLTAIWESVLGIHPISVDDNFFDLGGQSVLAAQLFAKIAQQFGHRLPLALLFEAPTIQQLATALEQSGWSPSWSSLVPIQPLGQKTPFFAVHTGHGRVFHYRQFSQHLGSDQPFYGLQAQGLDGKSPPYSTFEAMASHYIQEIQTIQPEGPYFLGGFCLGGTIALEMAQQLQNQGHTIALLVVLDPAYSLPQLGLPEPELRPPHFKKDLRHYIQLCHYFHRTGGLRRHAAKKLLKIAKQHWPGQRSTASIEDDLQDPNIQNIINANAAALHAYQHQPYAGTITFLQSSNYVDRPYGKAIRQKYSQLATAFDYHLVETVHEPLFPTAKHWAIWGKALSDCLDTAQRKATATAIEQPAVTEVKEVTQFADGLKFYTE